MRRTRQAAIATGRRSVFALVAAASAAFVFASSDAHVMMRGARPAGSATRYEAGGPQFVVHRGGDRAPTIADGQPLRRRCRSVLRDRRRQPHRGRKPRRGRTDHPVDAREPLPAQYVPIATGSAGGEGTYTIAGYGTAQESERMRSAGLREARLVNDSRYNALVDPRRRSPISASACMGDSGGPVASRQALRAGRHRRARVELCRHRRLRLSHALFFGQRRDQLRVRAGRHDAPSFRAAPASRCRQVQAPALGRGALNRLRGMRAKFRSPAGHSKRRARSTRSIASVAAAMSARLPVSAAINSSRSRSRHAGSSVDRVEQHVRGIAQRDQLGAVCEHDDVRKLASVVGAKRLLEHRGQA